MINQTEKVSVVEIPVELSSTDLVSYDKEHDLFVFDIYDKTKRQFVVLKISKPVFLTMNNAARKSFINTKPESDRVIVKLQTES